LRTSVSLNHEQQASPPFNSRTKSFVGHLLRRSGKNGGCGARVISLDIALADTFLCYRKFAQRTHPL
jgi:hypothetical protein